MRCVQFQWTSSCFSKKRTTLPNKRSVGPSSRLKTVDLDYRSSLSLTRLVRFWFKSLQSFTAHDGQFPQGNLFLLAMCTHEMSLYLCSIFCSRSLVQVSTASYRVLSRGTRPKLYPVTLSIAYIARRRHPYIIYRLSDKYCIYCASAPHLHSLSTL